MFELEQQLWFQRRSRDLTTTFDSCVLTPKRSKISLATEKRLPTSVMQGLKGTFPALLRVAKRMSRFEVFASKWSVFWKTEMSMGSLFCEVDT